MVLVRIFILSPSCVIFGTIVDNTSRSFCGKQHLETLDGYIIALSIRSGLPYMDMYPPTPTEFDSYPHVFFTSDMEWNPQRIVDEYTVHDMDLTDNDLEHNDPNTINTYRELLPVARQQDIHFNAGTTLTLNNCLLILALSLVFVSNTR
jgi:hypothetical protein